MDGKEDKKCDLDEAGSSISCNSSNSHDAVPTRYLNNVKLKTF